MSAEDEKAYIRKFLVVSLLIVGVPAAIDVSDGSFLFSFAVCSIWLLFALLVAVINALGKVREWGALFTFAAIPFVTLLLVLGNSLLQNWVARTNAKEIAQASEQYRAKNGVYPSTLDDLVPGYLRSVPRAKYALSGKFEYAIFSGRHTLYWTSIPPFFRCFYEIERSRLDCHA
ncbi:MAG: hypothetical protein WCA09_05090 [Burkholderiales bacterium]